MTIYDKLDDLCFTPEGKDERDDDQHISVMLWNQIQIVRYMYIFFLFYCYCFIHVCVCVCFFNNDLISKSAKQLPNCLEIAETSVVLIVFAGVICDISPYAVTVSFCRSTRIRYQ